MACFLEVEGQRSSPELGPPLSPGLTLSIFLAENLCLMDLAFCGTRRLTRQMRRLQVCSSLSQHPLPAAQAQLGPARPWIPGLWGPLPTVRARLPLIAPAAPASPRAALKLAHTGSI